MQTRVVVIGGGVAGCSSALALAGRGVSVTLLEASQRLGGRYCSVDVDGIGRQIDSTQNVFFRNFERFLQLIATCELRDSVKLQNSTSLPFLEVEKGRISNIESGTLSPPNHLSTSFVKANFLGLADKISMQKAVQAIQSITDEKRQDLDDLSFQEWLEINGQSKRAISRFWNPISKLALNVDSSKSSAASAIFLFRKALLGKVNALDVGCFTNDFSSAVSSSLRRTLAASGVEVHLSSSVTSLFREAGVVTGVKTREALFAADRVIICTPIAETARLLTGSSASIKSHEVAENLAKLGNTSQIGIHAFHEGPILPEGIPFVTCCDEPMIQMLFDRSGELDDGNRDGLPGHWICTPVSHADDYLHWDDELIQTEYERVIGSAFPNSPALMEFHVVRKNRAATSMTTGSQRLRPSPIDAGQGVILGGDWIDIEWPSSLEGETRAGLVAAATLLREIGASEFEDWHHDEKWPDWPNPAFEEDYNWRIWK